MNRLASEGHVVEELNGVRCSIVEKNASLERVEFLKKLLEHNGFEVVTAPTPPPPVKPAPKPVAPKPVIDPVTGEAVPAAAVPPPPPPPPPAPVGPPTFTIGVTNISFHPMLAVYERSLKTSEGKVVSIAYWNQETEKRDELYWERRVK